MVCIYTGADKDLQSIDEYGVDCIGLDNGFIGIG